MKSFYFAIVCLTNLNSKWQEVDHEDSVAGAVLNPTSGIDVESDPLGLGHTVKFSPNAIPLVYLFIIHDRIREMDMETSAYIDRKGELVS